MNNDKIIEGLELVIEGLRGGVGSPIEPPEPTGDEPTVRPGPPVSSLSQIGHPDSWWNSDVSDAVVYSRSSEILSKLQNSLTADHDYGANGDGGQYWLPKLDLNMRAEEPYGHTINYISPEIADEVKWVLPSEWTLDGPYDPHGDYLKIPVHPSFELQNGGDSSDSHFYVYNDEYLWEFYQLRNYGKPNMTTGLSTRYSLTEVNAGRGLGCTSSNAAGDVYAPLICTPDEIARGRIDHAIALTLPNNIPEGHLFIEPAQHSPLQYDTGGYMPYGSRFRLRSDFNVDAVNNGPARTILTALKKYGFYHIDGINGTPLVPCVNDRGYENKWRDIEGMTPFPLWFHEGLPKWTDFEMLDGVVHSMRDVRCARTQLDER